VRPSRLLAYYRSPILEIVRRHHGISAAVFGSAARGEDHPGSDLDLAVKFDDRADIADLLSMEQDLRDALGIRVDVVSASPGEAVLGPMVPL
jgi:predicted nucleotidyltransferase